MKTLFIRVFACLPMCVLLYSTMTGCTQKRPESSSKLPAISEVLAKTTLLASKPDQQSSNKENDTVSYSEPLFSELGSGVVYTIIDAGLTQVVHNGVTGKKYKEVLYVKLSRDGSRIAYAARTETMWRMVIDGVEGRYFDEVSSPVFSPDGKQLLYDVRAGNQWHLVLNTHLSSEPCFGFYDKMISNDSSKTIVLENSAPDNKLARVVVRDLQFKKVSAVDVHASGIVYNRDKTRFAAISDSNGKQRAVVVSLIEPALVSEGKSYNEITRLSFGVDGETLTYVAVKDGKSFLVRNDSEEALSGGKITQEPPAARPGSKSVGIALTGDKGAFMHFAFNDNIQKEKRYDEVAFMTYDSSGKSYAYGARNGKNMFYVVNGKESPSFEKALAPVFSPDGSRVVAKVRKDGKRFVIVMDLDARVMSQHVPFDMIYGITFTADGKSVAYGVLDGQKLIWKVEKL